MGMGCSTSKGTLISSSILQQDTNTPSLSRTLSLPAPLIHHPPTGKGDSHHFVFLTSTTYGSLVRGDPKSTSSTASRLLPSTISLKQSDCHPPSPPSIVIQSLSTEDRSIINAWELMEGLEDSESLNSIICQSKGQLESKIVGNEANETDVASFLDRSSSTSIHSHFSDKETCESDKTCIENGSTKLSQVEQKVENHRTSSLTKPLWKHLSEESLLSELDPSVATRFRLAINSNQQPIFVSSTTKPVSAVSQVENSIFLHGCEEKIVLYFTSLRGIRKTYQECSNVRRILRGFKVPIDERDISMDSSFRKELQNMLNLKNPSLPQLFIRGKHVGGAEEIKQLHENGDLGKLLKGFPVQDPNIICQGCGDARFVLCLNCDGSRKVYSEDQCELTRCSECNENGLIRCPNCCS